MSSSLAPNAIRLAGMMCRSLGWRPADFWAATPAEIAAVLTGDDGAAGAALTRHDFETLLERDQNG